MNANYKKMLKIMQEKESAAKKKRGRKKAGEKPWFLYILECVDGTFYTGVTNDLERRFKMHEAGRASKYTRTRRPVKLLYQEKLSTRTQALVRECAVKALPRKSKERLISSALA
jgi:predicted GIY-YIG superfamily endonuclease